MATISSGSVTVTIQPGEQYRVIATGEAYVDIGGGSTQSYRLVNGASERLLGGFIVATPVTIRVISGSVDYINVSGTGDSVALSLAQSSRTDINGMVASTADGALLLPDGMFKDRRLGRSGIALFDFSDTANWSLHYGGGIKVSDAINSPYSTSGLKLTINNAFEGIKKSFGSNTFAIQSGTVIKFLVNVPEAAFLAGSLNLQIKFSSDNNATKGLAFNFTPDYFKAPGLQMLSIRAGEDGTQEMSAGATWTTTGGEAWGNNFNYFQAICNGAAWNGVPVTFHAMVVGNKDVPRIVWTFDDIDASTMTVIAPTLAAFGFSAGLMMDGDAATVARNAANAKILIEKYGWSVGAMGVTHTSYVSNGRDIGADWDTCVANFVAAGLPAPTTWAYPLNAGTPALDAVLAAKGVTWRRSGGVDILQNIPGGGICSANGMVRSGTSQHLATNYDAGTAYRQVKNRIEALRNSGGILSLFTHKETALAADWGLGGDVSQWYKMLDYIAYLRDSEGLQVVKPTDIKRTLASQIFI